jgi:hypothetical protein
MSFSRYAATIPSFQQVLGAIAGLLDIAEAFCVEKGIAAQDLTQARLAADMFPSAAHSLGSIEGIRMRVFLPDMTPLCRPRGRCPAEVFGAMPNAGEDSDFVRVLAPI